MSKPIIEAVAVVLMVAAFFYASELDYQAQHKQEVPAREKF